LKSFEEIKLLKKEHLTLHCFLSLVSIIITITIIIIIFYY
jgi:hypothetical protein